MSEDEPDTYVDLWLLTDNVIDEDAANLLLEHNMT